MLPEQQPRAWRACRGRRCLAVLRALKQQIDEGSLTPGARLPPLRDLAASLLVSTNTIRNAIRVLEEEGYLYHVRSVGTFVRPAPRRRGDPGQPTIALVATDISSPFGTGIAQAVEQACRTRGWHLQVYDDRLDPRLEIENLSRLAGSGIRGAIIIPTCDESGIEALFKLKLSGVPFVLVDRSVHGLKVDFVGADHAKGAFLATAHLLDQGHRRILMLTNRPLCSSVEQRIRGYEEALSRYECCLYPHWRVWFDWRLKGRHSDEVARWQSAQVAILPVLQTIRLPVAVFTVNEYAAWGTLDACRTLGLSVPGDVSIVSFDDSELSRAMHPPLTTVAQPLAAIGRQAVALLEARLHTPDADPQHLNLNVELIERQSAGPPAGVSQENVA